MPGIVLTQTSLEPAPFPIPSSGKLDNAPSFIGWEDLIYVTDLFMAGGVREITLLGSDPLDHPHFMDMVAYLLERGCQVSALTSGMAGDGIIEDAGEMGSFLHKDHVNFFCDMTDLAHERLLEPYPVLFTRFLEALNNRITPWITLQEPQFSLEQLVFLINEYNLRRVIRVSLGQPGEPGGNPHLEPDQIQYALSSLFSHTELLDAFRVKLHFDCGFPPCCFTDDQLAYMVRNVLGFSVSPCRPDVTVGPDMTMWSCRQLPGFSRRSVLEFDSLQEIRQFYGEQHFAVRFESSGAFVACDTCMLREDIICSGGCVAPILPRFVGEHPYSVAENPLRRKEVFE
jgi:hypothetical protein